MLRQEGWQDRVIECNKYGKGVAMLVSVGVKERGVVGLGVWEGKNIVDSGGGLRASFIMIFLCMKKR